MYVIILKISILTYKLIVFSFVYLSKMRLFLAKIS